MSGSKGSKLGASTVPTTRPLVLADAEVDQLAKQVIANGTVSTTAPVIPTLITVASVEGIATPAARQANVLTNEWGAIRSQLVMRFWDRPWFWLAMSLLASNGLSYIVHFHLTGWEFAWRMILATICGLGSSKAISVVTLNHRTANMRRLEQIEESWQKVAHGEQLRCEQQVNEFFARLDYNLLSGWDSTVALFQTRLNTTDDVAKASLDKCNNRVKEIRKEIDRVRKLFTDSKIDLSVASSRLAVEDKIQEILAAVASVCTEYPDFKKYLQIPDDFSNAPTEVPTEVEKSLVKTGEKAQS